jgi:uncharacterized repeat protein (TIGR02543 family)
MKKKFTFLLVLFILAQIFPTYALSNGTATIKYNANEGTGTPLSHTVTISSDGVIRYTLTTSEPTRSGYTFLGWRLENSTAYNIDKPGQSIEFSIGSTDKNVTFTYYAQWKALSQGTARHAPNMYVNWEDNGSYDIMTVDWYCQQDAENTYWAVHNWQSGYAGFQNKGGTHVLLLSLWDMDDGTQPTIEYSKDGSGGTFGGEGTGKQVFTNYGWQVGKWYTMRVQVWSYSEKSYIAQWVREDGGQWIKTAVISYPVVGYKFESDSMFQEDFLFNNLLRSCRLKNAYGRFYQTSSWDSWEKNKLTNTYFPTSSHTWGNVIRNICYDCDWGTDSSNSYVWVQSGGGDLTENGKTAPPVTYTLSQNATPSDTVWLTAQPTSVNQSTPTPAPTPAISIDVNHDGAINMRDVMLLAGAFNTVRNDAGFVDAYDLNRDGAINMLDIMMVANKFNTVV